MWRQRWHGDLFRTIGWSTNVTVPVERNPRTEEDITRSREEYLKLGSRKNPKPPVSTDSESSSYQEYGMISNRVFTSTEMMEIKRDHWAIEAHHYSIDQTFREDENPAHSSKFSSSMIRKIAYNLIRWSIAAGHLEEDHSMKVSRVKVEARPDLIKMLIFEPLKALQVSKP